jgi:UDP-N-acetylglucosamine diphosphorylase / glucose-1-phosphate thymidylyltransferase / UDP-N-acetylgalactosamine diphosphorylase / glucosamine-1-phosphate N-acetyltransferase / galactosamine-1-phosphate N-acetyltransferase
MIAINDFFSTIPFRNHLEKYRFPWEITSRLKEIIGEIIPQLGEEFEISNGIAIHKSAHVESGVTLNSPMIIMDNCHIGANAYFREGVLLGSSVKIGPCSEIKSSLIFSNAAIAHLNYIGNSIIGNYVNFEAGSIAANHYNEREDKQIRISFEGNTIETGVRKFGALVGDNSKIGANAVLSPGTILKMGSLVKRLELVEQCKEK